MRLDELSFEIRLERRTTKGSSSRRIMRLVPVFGDFTNQNATQFENTETEKGRGRERRHERGKNKVTDANATTKAEQCKSLNSAKHIFIL